jgi:hypothetical protein
MRISTCLPKSFIFVILLAISIAGCSTHYNKPSYRSSYSPIYTTPYKNNYTRSYRNRVDNQYRNDHHHHHYRYHAIR